MNVEDPKDLEFTLKGLTAGSTIEVYVVPINDGGGWHRLTHREQSGRRVRRKNRGWENWRSDYSPRL